MLQGCGFGTVGAVVISEPENQMKRFELSIESIHHLSTK